MMTYRQTPQFDEEDIHLLGAFFLERFLPFFQNQPEGSLLEPITLEFSRKMRQRVGLAYLFEAKVRLNLSYFLEHPQFLPYALFHEMTHLWLYQCHLDPGHTARFYLKMRDFESTGYPVDPEVYVHSRVAPEAKYVYICSRCENRWYMRALSRQPIFCGFCYRREGVEYVASQVPYLEESSGDIACTQKAS